MLYNELSYLWHREVYQNNDCTPIRNSYIDKIGLWEGK